MYVSGYLNDRTKPNMSYLEARDLMIKSVALAIELDSGSGGNIRINDVKSNGKAS